LLANNVISLSRQKREAMENRLNTPARRKSRSAIFRSMTPNGFRLDDTQTVCYPNKQPSMLLWFHDQHLGATRLNRPVNKQEAKAIEEDG
jgi:hypothetical protein